ncbi:MAG: hypothetical protein ACRY3E_00535 [Candidatus Lariskella arthropodorum]
MKGSNVSRFIRSNISSGLTYNKLCSAAEKGGDALQNLMKAGLPQK